MADLSLHVESCSSTTENVIPTLPQCQWLPWGASTHKGTWPFDHVTFRDDMTNKSHYISTTTVLMATKVGRMLTYLEVLFHISYITLWSGGLVNSRGKLKNPLPQCHGHHEELLLVKPHEHLTMWSSEITWQTKTIISLLPLPMQPRPQSNF